MNEVLDKVLKLIDNIVDLTGKVKLVSKLTVVYNNEPENTAKQIVAKNIPELSDKISTVVAGFETQATKTKTIDIVRNMIDAYLSDIKTEVTTLNTELNEEYKKLIDQYVTNLNQKVTELDLADLKHNIDIILNNPLYATYAKKKLVDNIDIDYGFNNGEGIYKIKAYIEDVIKNITDKDMSTIVSEYENRFSFLESEVELLDKESKYSGITTYNNVKKIDLETLASILSEIKVKTEKDPEVVAGELVKVVEKFLTLISEKSYNKEEMLKLVNVDIVDKIIDQLVSNVKTNLISPIETTEVVDYKNISYNNLLATHLLMKKEMLLKLNNYIVSVSYSIDNASKIVDDINLVLSKIIIGD